MKTTVYLNINSKGNVRISKTPVALKINEIRAKLSINVPDQMFDRPTINANITVDNAAMQPSQINSDLVIKAKELLQKSLGVDVNLTLLPVEEKKKSDDSDFIMGGD